MNNSLISPLPILRSLVPQSFNPSYSPAAGWTYEPWQYLHETSAVVIDGSDALVRLIEQNRVTTLEALLELFWHSTVDEALQCEFTTLVVLCFDGIVWHSLREAALAARQKSNHKLYADYFESAKGRRALADALHEYAVHRSNIRTGARVVLHGPWAQPFCVSAGDDRQRRLSAVVADEALLPPDRALPASWCRSGDLVVFWCRALLFPYQNDEPPHSVVVVSRDGYTHHALLLFANWMMHAPNQQLWHLTLRSTFVAGLRPQRVAGQLRNESVELPEYVNLLLAASTTAVAAAPRFDALTGGDAASVVPLLLALLLPLGSTEFSAPMRQTAYFSLKDPVQVFNATSRALLHKRAGVHTSAALHLKQQYGDPWLPTTVEISRQSMADLLALLDQGRPQTSTNKQALIGPAATCSWAARQTLWMAMLLNASLPASPVPDPLATDAYNVSLWGYARQPGHQLPSPHAVISSRDKFEA